MNKHTATRAGKGWCLAFLIISAMGILQGLAVASSPSLGEALQPEIDAFVAQDKASMPAACQLLFVGSSSIVKWKETLSADMAPMPVINRGFGGSQIEDVNRWFREVVAPYRPRAIVFYAGENDIDAGKPPERVVADFEAFMVLKEKALGKTPVYFISLKPSKLRFGELPLQTTVNDEIKSLVQKRTDLHYIDVVAPMLRDGRPKDIFQSDDLHMTRKGYEIWTDVVRTALLPNTAAEARRCHRKQ